MISIHAPRAGSDVADVVYDEAGTVISIHAPRAGSDCRCLCRSSLSFVFQSTLPVRGATHKVIEILRYVVFQSTLPVRGATAAVLYSVAFFCISIHAPRAGSDA